MLSNFDFDKAWERLMKIMEASQIKSDLEFEKLRKTQAEASEKAREEMKELRKSQAEASEKAREEMKELRKAQAEVSAQIKQTDEQMKRNEKISNRTTEELKQAMKQTDEQIKNSDEKLKKIGIIFGNFQNNLGEEKESMFFEYLNKHKKLGNVSFDEVSQNLFDGKREYDIVMQNGKYIAIIEVKQKAHPDDLVKLMTEQVESFKTNFIGLVNNKKVILAIASPVITPAVRKAAQAKGIVVITQNGDNVQVEASDEITSF